jgi:dihydrolipoamide dehydrogenase
VNAKQFDLLVIGGGPGGYVAAIRAAQLGLNTACVEKRGSLGGTCLNVGCIPSKALLQSSHFYEQAEHNFAQHGVKVSGLGLDLDAMMQRKAKAVEDLTKGVEFLFKKNKVTYLKGHARLAGPDRVEVDGQSYGAKNIIIATGSDIVQLPGIEIDEQRIVSSTGALSLTKVPERLLIIGGGVIGLELGSVWARLGAKVEVVEFLDHLIPGSDAEIAKQFQKILQKQGITFQLSTKVTQAKVNEESVTVTLEPAQGGEAKKARYDVVLVAVGRRPYTDGLGLEAAGITVDERGRIPVNADLQTVQPSIWAIGDVVAGAMLAHKAEDEGAAVAERIAGQKPHIDYNCIPSVIYTHPEVASVGQSEEAIRAAGTPYAVGKFPFSANSRARAVGEKEGLVKVIAHRDSDEILGVHIIGPEAGTLIQEAVTLMEFKASAEDMARISHAHPTFTEAVREAGLAVAKRAIHI